MRAIVGIDPSLTSTGLVRIEEDLEMISDAFGTPSEYGSMEARYKYSIRRLRDLLKPGDLVLMEDYAFGVSPAKSRLATLGELGGLMKMTCNQVTGMWPIPVSSTTMKKFLTGRGVGVKDADIKLAVYKKYGQEFPTTDECVAFVLANLGLCLLGFLPFGKEEGIAWLGYELACAKVVHKALEKEGRLGVLDRDCLQTLAEKTS